jgi:uncharacterized protein YbbC (DUF1343 family)
MNDVRIGLEMLVECDPLNLRDASLGLLMNQASVDAGFQYACDVIDRAFPGQLKRLFSPQHGFWGEQQANMIESSDAVYAPLGLPVHSLYSETRRPTPEMLNGLDVLLIDLQDVGTRVYTFVWTLFECLKACAECGVKVVVLDRPNPLGGLTYEGPLIESGFESFVGNSAIPMRHGMTLGELALFLNVEHQFHAEVHVISMNGWRRAMLWSDTVRNWVLPSPNMPTPATSYVYPGQVMLEGTNLSEGRGTTCPFEFCGAPWIDSFALTRRLEMCELPGLTLQPFRFRPTFDKWKGETCGGVAIRLTDPAAVRSFRFTVQLLEAVRQLDPGRLQWLDPPYEYEYHKPPIDILFGSDRLRHAMSSPEPLDARELDELCRLDEIAWHEKVSRYRLYAE